VIPEHLLQPCDIILVSGKGLVSRAIRWFTDSEWSHAALYVGGGKQAIIEAMETGVEVNPLQTLVKGHTKVCVLRYPGLLVEQAEVIKAKAYDLTYHRYDFPQLITLGVYNFFRKLGVKMSFLVSNSRNNIICSELIAVCYKAAMIEFSKKTKMVTPASLYTNDGLTTIYEAKL